LSLPSRSQFLTLIDAVSHPDCRAIENGTVRSLRLAWRADLRQGWGAEGPILHLDATMRPELVIPFVPDMAFAESLMATEPHVRVRQILGAPTSAKALTPLPEAAAREHDAAAGHLRDLATLIALRAMDLRGRSATLPDLLVIAQKAAVDALRTIGLPRNTEAVHFNALSGIDRWRDVAGLMILGRTLPTPATVETIAAAVTNRPPLESRGAVSWWYGSVERRIGLADGEVHVVSGEAHADPTAEAVRWTICEGELIQAIGRGRGVNRTADTPLEVDLLTDVVLPVTVHEVLQWDDICPTRHDAMLAAGVVLENAADMANAFPELWTTRDAAKKQNQRRGTNCYYRDVHNSDLSPSSAVVTYRPSGAGQKDREARFDPALIPDPRAWLEARVGPLAHFEITGGDVLVAAPPSPADLAAVRARLRASLNAVIRQRAANDRERLNDLSMRLDVAMQQRITVDRGRLAALSARLEAARPTTAAA
jgi:putative DNA primase/helicase